MIITGGGDPLEISIESNSIDIAFETTPTGVLLVPVAGRDGTSISIAGTVATYANLPFDLDAADRGSLYIVEADGLGYVWSGTAWPADGEGFEIRGPEGPAGPANSLSIGTVTSGAPAASITGTAPDQTLNLTLPKGDKGDQGDEGPANTLSVGEVTGGTSASATITGTAPSQTLNLVLPKGDKGDQGDKGDIGEVSEAELSAAIATRAPVSHTHATSEVTGLDAALSARELTANKGAANGYAPLDSTSKVPAANLPSYVDDVLEYTNLAGFPATGTSGLLYVALDTNKVYRWSGSSYTEVSPSLAIGTTSSTACAGNDPRLSDTRTPTDGTVTNAKVAAGAAIALSKLATGYVAGSDNAGARTLAVWVGTEAQYAAIGTKDANTLYFRSA